MSYIDADEPDSVSQMTFHLLDIDAFISLTEHVLACAVFVNNVTIKCPR